MPPAEPEPVRQWLDEVRVQRQAREERRRADKEARDAHRRWVDPWGAAQQEAREQETQRRRNAFFEHIERDREAFRIQVPWGFPQDPRQEEAAGSQAEKQLPTDGDTVGVPRQAVPHPSPYPPTGWDNRWYYRGF